MIFVTVGTHEDPFDRLINEMDRLCGSGCLGEEIFIQTGYASQPPVYAQYAQFIGYQEMDSMIRDAHIVITHGGPGSIMHALRYNKLPIVVPRQKAFAEHVDDHQVRFSQRLEKAGKAIAVLEIGQMEKLLLNYDQLAGELNFEIANQSNLDQFIAGLEEITQRLLKL